ncbi:MAG: M16 family metallopeptidase [Rhodothermales bacterium]
MTDPSIDSTLESLASRVEERTIGPCRVLMLKTPVRSVVSCRGSFVSHPHFAGGDELVQVLTVKMLDKGTQLRDRFDIASVLEDRGAQLEFSSEALRVAFQGRALKEDLPVVLDVMAEELRQPLFDAAEFAKAKIHYESALQRALENTASQASSALSRRIYSEAHPNYTVPTRETLIRLKSLSVDQIRAYHTGHFGAKEMVLVLVGDLDPEVVEQVVRDAFGDWPAHPSQPAYTAAAAMLPPGRSDIFISGKKNVDVRMGHALPVRRMDEAYLPLYLANYILGGNFSARLMTTVRDEMGLTYGIGSHLSGVTTAYEGHWQVRVTLSQELLEQGIEATRNVVQRFIEEGPTEAEIADKKTTITGAFKVGLATTGGLAAALHRNAVRGFDVEYLDRFPEEVEAVTYDQVRAAVQHYFKPDAFQLAMAGMLPEPGV